MPKVPLVERQVQANAFRPTPLSLPQGYGRYVENTGLTELGKAVEGMAEQAKQKGDQVALVEAQRKLDEWEAGNLFDPRTGALARKGKDAFGLPDKLGSDFDKYGQEIFDSMANDDQKVAFQKMWYSRADQLKRTLYSHERTEMDGYAKANNQALVDSSMNRAALYYNVPEIVDKSISDARVAARSQATIEGMPEEAITQKELEAESKVRLGTLTRMADANPKLAVDYYKRNAARFTAEDLLRAQSLMSPTERKYKAQDVAGQAINNYQPKVTSSEMIDYVMYELEGGDKVVIDNDGGTAKFGINNKHNDLTPEEVAALTPEEARAIKKRNYWDAMKIDDLPADMRLIAYDAAIQHGADADTKKMIEEANGDPRALIEIRRDYYIKLAKQNPTQNGPQLEGWMNRLAKLSAQVDLMRGQQPSMEEMNARIDSMTDDLDVAADAKQLIKAQFDAREADQKAAQAAASDEAWRYVGSGMRVPASVESRMKPKEIVEMREAMNKGMTPDPVVYNDIRQRVLTGQKLYMQDANGKTVEASLQDFRWVLGNKYDEIAAIASDPSKLVNARSTDEIIKSGYGRLLGRSGPESAEQYEKVERFRQIVQQEINAIQAGGKVATPDDIQKIVDRNLLSVDPPGFGGNKPISMIDRSKPYEVEGIRSDAVYQVRGNGKIQEISYDTLIGALIQGLEKRNIQVTPEALAKAYQDALNSGKLAAKYQR